jgi:hypothetical protein
MGMLAGLTAEGRGRDFPEWLPPVVVKELRQGLRGRGFVWPFLLTQALLVLWLTVELAAAREGWSWDLTDQLGHVIFWLVVLVLVGAVIPLRLLGALKEERQGEAAQLALLAGLTRVQLVHGKWRAHLLLAGLVLASLLPYAVARYFLGALEWWSVAWALLSVVGATASLGAVVIAASGYENVSHRLIFAALGLLYAVVPALGFIVASPDLDPGAMSGSLSGRLMEVMLAAVALLGPVLWWVHLTLLGLAWGRGQLRHRLRPWELPPGRQAATTFVLSPLYLLAAGLFTCGFGTVPLLIILIIVDTRLEKKSEV